MKRLFSRLLLSGLVLALTLSLAAAPASADTKKKKKSAEKKKEEKKEQRHEARHMEKRYVSGTNIWGRAGLLYADTAEVASVGQIEGSAHFTYQSLASASFAGYSSSDDLFGIPFGLHFGAAENLDLYASGDLMINSISSNVPGFVGGSSSQFLINIGGKYRIAATNSKTPDFAVGGDVTIPTNGGNAVVTPKGMVTYTLDSGLLLNGEMGIAIAGTTYVLADAGVGVPFGDKFTGIAEIGANQNGYLGSVLAAGVRADLSGMKLQGLLG